MARVTVTLVPASWDAADEGGRHSKRWSVGKAFSGGAAGLHVASIVCALGVGTGLAVLGGLAPWLAGGGHSGAELQRRAWSAHGVVMVYLGLLAGAPALVGYALTSSGADAAPPRKELAETSLGLYWVSASLILVGLTFGGVRTGYDLSLSYGIDHGPEFLWLSAGVFFATLSAGLSGARWIVALANGSARSPGGSPRRFVAWTLASAGAVHVLAAGVLAIVLLLMVAEELWGVGFYRAELGGDPRLLRHLYSFYLHPSLLVCVLPAFGVIAHQLDRGDDGCCKLGERPGASRLCVAVSILGAASWGRHLFADGLSFPAETAFAFTGLLHTLALAALGVLILWPRRSSRALGAYRALVLACVVVPLAVTTTSMGALTLPHLGELLLATAFVRLHLHALAFSAVLAVIPALWLVEQTGPSRAHLRRRSISWVTICLLVGECSLFASELFDSRSGLHSRASAAGSTGATALVIPRGLRGVGLGSLMIGGLGATIVACKARRGAVGTDEASDVV